jgi:multiple sugar transport system ATP-binding protein
MVEDGELMVLVGPSGSGKSTLLRMIAGLEGITEGRLWIGDRLVNDVPAQHRDIAMVFQSYALYPHMTVRENLSFALKLRKAKRPEIERRINGAAALLGIESILDRKPRQLSGGQRQRVALGRAIVREPQVFLFDEPLSNLDAKLRVHMRTEIAALHNRLGATAIYVTHDQVEAMTLGQRIVVLHEGVVQQSGNEFHERPDRAG